MHAALLIARLFVSLLSQGKLGELLLSLCYQTSVGAITVEIIEARGLKAMDINGFSGKWRRNKHKNFA